MRTVAARGQALFASLMMLMCAARPAHSETPLRLAFGTAPAGRNNPHESGSITRLWFYAAAYDAMTFITGDGVLEPWLALEWSQDTPTSWVFRLRPNVTFSNGAPLTAQDVINNITYLSSAAGRIEPMAVYVSSIVRAEAVDDLTVRLTTAKPDPMLARKLSLVRIAGLPKGATFDRDTLTEKAIGTGPYKVESWQVSAIKLTAVPGAWRRAPTQTLEAIASPNPIGRKNALATGRVDIAMAAFEPFEAADSSTLPYAIDVDQLPAVVGLAFNTTHSIPLRDVRVRKALDLAVNKAQIVGTLFSGLAKVASQPARREFFGYDATLKPDGYDPERAKALLAEAGYKDGLKLTMTLTGGATVWDQIFQAVAADLRKVGVALSIEMVPEQVTADYQFRKGYPGDAFGATYFSPSFDALDVMRQHSCAWPVAWYCDQTATQAIDRALNEPDLSRREDLTRAIMRQTRENAQGLFLYESIGFTGYNRRIANFRSDFSFIRYELMTVSEPKL